MDAKKARRTIKEILKKYGYSNRFGLVEKNYNFLVTIKDWNSHPIENEIRAKIMDSIKDINVEFLCKNGLKR